MRVELIFTCSARRISGLALNSMYFTQEMGKARRNETARRQYPPFSELNCLHTHRITLTNEKFY
jgi:hypothetical protein